ncbi:MAG: sigma-54 dependent transcriptional regulator [Desulfobacterales bacterium]|nr:sigma-54 dependent transcriptional regulator [Desulfobacterales bacterium]
MTQIQTARILVVDDDPGVIHSMIRLIQDLGFHADSAATLTGGLRRVKNKTYDIVLLDVNFPDGNGIDRIDEILAVPDPPQVIIMTAYSDPDGAQLAIESGAWDYIQKPASSKDLRLQILRALQYQAQKRISMRQVRFESPDIIGSSQPIRQCLHEAARIAASDANVLITGETGTGKELFAKAIHENSTRRNGSFIVVDCSILTENFIESVLFGHEKGGFTGADKKRNGLVKLANGGTLFLDEVGELPESMQTSFLRVLQEKKFRPVGSETEIYSDFRVISATNKDLEQMADQNRFRTDLLYRLKSFTLELPALRVRKEDIPAIGMSQMRRCCSQNRIEIKEMSLDFLDMLQKYDWPGNVRELNNTIESCVASARFEHKLFAVHLPRRIRTKVTRASVKKKEPRQPYPDVPSPDAFHDLTHKQIMEKTEHAYLKSLYAQTGGDIKQLIKSTGISRAVLYRKLKKYDIK